jgi:hypothetical protein
LRHARPFLSRYRTSDPPCKRAAAGRPDPTRILAQTISFACPGGADPYAVLGVLVEGAVQTLAEHIPKERQAEAAMRLKHLLEERMKACGIPGADGND